MDPDERLMALKKAYADIILNTAKEAAQRIMVSERKAQRFEIELKVAKEEALRMLLRLKHMMDAKISEAEFTSLSQQKKIEEIEAQLQEAEDIVRDLREELSHVKAELERVTRDKAQHLSDCVIANPGQISEMNRLYTSHFVEFQPPQSQAESIVSSAMKLANQNCRNAAHDGYCPSIYMGNSYRGSLDLPSIILRSKEPELYRNGCTQRIRACDRNVLDRELSLPGKMNKTEDEKSVREGEGCRVIRKAHSHKDEKRSNSEKKAFKPHNLLPNWSFIKKRKRAKRYRRSRSPSPRNVLGQSVKTIQAVETYPTSARDAAASSGENPSEIFIRLLSDEADPGLQSDCAGTSVIEAVVASCTDQKGEKTEKPLAGEIALQDMGCRESLEIPISETNLGKISPPSMKLEAEVSETSNIHASRTINDGRFKYTFQRKRKRDSLVRLDENEFSRNNASEEKASHETNTPNGNANLEKCTSDKNTSLENSTPMMKVAVEQNGSTDSKLFFITESSRDSQQLVQVANQVVAVRLKLQSLKWGYGENSMMMGLQQSNGVKGIFQTPRGSSADLDIWDDSGSH